MRFHLDHTPERSPFPISHQHSVLLAGSCFSENMGARFAARRFNTLSNPGGTLFNPMSIAEFLTDALEQSPINKSLFIEREGRFFSYRHHSSLSANSAAELEAGIREQQQRTHAFLKSCDHLFITFGTAWYYHHKQLNSAVANCHKQPAQLFSKELASVKLIVDAFTGLISTLRALNPNIKIIFTVSPVKHLRDGLVENSQSKASLILATHEICRSQGCHYFPAYELVSDDLRDYRFYKEDLAHPNAQAIAYVWQKFSDSFFNEPTKQVNKLLEDLDTAMAHKPLQTENDPRLAAYIARLEAEIERLEPGIRF